MLPGKGRDAFAGMRARELAVSSRHSSRGRLRLHIKCSHNVRAESGSDVRRQGVYDLGEMRAADDDSDDVNRPLGRKQRRRRRSARNACGVISQVCSTSVIVKHFESMAFELLLMSRGNIKIDLFHSTVGTNMLLASILVSPH